MVIGVDVGGTNMRAGLVKDSTIIKTEQVVISNRNSKEETLEQLFSIIGALGHHNIEGIGIGVPSSVDAEKGIVYDVVNIPSWKGIELKTILETKFGTPAFVENDINCLALGEQLFGEGSSFSSFVTVGIGTGLGAAIIIEKKLYKGVLSGAGEIGYIPYLDKNLEFYTSGMYFESLHTTAEAAFLAASQGEVEALKAWQCYGHHFAQAIKMILYTYSPEAIIIGGGLSNAYSFFKSSMYNGLQDFIFPETLHHVTILPSMVKNIAILGAAALVKNKVI